MLPYTTSLRSTIVKLIREHGACSGSGVELLTRGRITAKQAAQCLRHGANTKPPVFIKLRGAPAYVLGRGADIIT